MASTPANENVLEFYKALPFNYHGSAQAQAESIRRTDFISVYPPAAALMRPGLQVVDVGCGSGWLANSMAHHHQVRATGVDFNPVAVARGREAAGAMGLDTAFVESDLFSYVPEQPFDLATSIGVLHHTNDCHAGVRHVCRNLVRPGGHVLIGLYHTHGRKPFLDHFRAMKDRGAGEGELFREYRKLHAQIKDETLLMSWFRDQVLHPHETQHTLAELLPMLAEEGIRMLSTSLNRFGPAPRPKELAALETAQEDIGREWLRKSRYFPGFFVFFGRKD